MDEEGDSGFEEEAISEEVIDEEEMDTQMDPLNSGVNNAPPELEETEKPLNVEL